MAKPKRDVAVLEQQLVGLGTILQLQKQVRHAEDEAEFGFLVVNETLRLLRYQQAVFWRRRGRALRITAVSGVDRPNSHAPYILWLQKLFAFLLKKEKEPKIRAVAAEQLPAVWQQDWKEWSAAYGLWCPFVARRGRITGGLWLVRGDEPWQPSEQALLAQLADAYGHAWQTLPRRGRRGKSDEASGWRPLRWLLTAGIIAALALPIELTVLAPAQIVPLEPLVVSAPTRGVIEQFHVAPNQQVQAGQPLFSLDDTELRSRFQVTQKALAVAEAEYRQATQKSLFDRNSGVDIEVLRTRVEAKKAEVEYAAGELARIEVAADRDGVAVFADVNEWLGKPVVTGEKILLLADPNRKQLEIRVPLDNAVNLDAGARVRMFLNVAPDLDIPAVISQTSYQPKEVPGGEAAYIVKAAFRRDLPQLRIGLTGTAKIFGEKKRLYYYLFRRPWATVRATLGM